MSLYLEAIESEDDDSHHEGSLSLGQAIDIDDIETETACSPNRSHIPNVRFAGETLNFDEMLEKLVLNKEDLKQFMAAEVVVRNLSYSAKVTITKNTISDFNTSLRESWRFKEAVTGKKVILEGINFFIEPGMFLLVLGGPGSGRTSLLNMLANRVGRGEVGGEIYFDRKPIDPLLHQNKIAYIWSQDNIHIPSLTVEETFRFAMKLQLKLEFLRDQVKFSDGVSGPEEFLRLYLDFITQILHMDHRKDTLVGNDMIRGLSGGEKRRLTIGIELLKLPQLLIADEFTTGLDSRIAVDIGHFFRYIADHQTPVIASALQAPLALFKSFTHVLLLQRGQVAYFGPRKELAAYFNKLGFRKPAGLNPADFYADMLEHPRHYQPDLPSAFDFVEAWNVSPEAARVAEIIEAKLNTPTADSLSITMEQPEASSSGRQTNVPLSDEDDHSVPPMTARFTTSTSTQFYWLLWRSIMSLVHFPGPFIFKLVISVGI